LFSNEAKHPTVSLKENVDGKVISVDEPITEASTANKKTNYVIIVDFKVNVHIEYDDGTTKDGMFLDDAQLLGWDDRYDWFADDIYGSDIITSSGKIKKNDNGIISLRSRRGVYVGNTVNDCDDYCKMGNRESYNCTICELIETVDGWAAVPV
jgi:hypothetical protein